ncbi:MAG: HTH domain-containing protein [Candidatus Nitrosocaldus sp.]
MPKRYSIEEVKQRIVDVLKQSDSGLSGIEIAERTGINRVTITKYLNILETMGIIKRRSMGPVNVWYIKHGVDLSSKDILELQQLYMDALFTYDEDKARTILLNAIHSNVDPILLMSDVIIPTINTAGELYARGRMSAIDIMLVNNLAMESLDLIKFNASRVEVKRDAYAVFMSMSEKIGREAVDMKAASIAFYIKGWNPFLLGNVGSEAGLFLDIDIVRFINKILRDRGKGIILLYISAAEEFAALNELIRSVKEKLEKNILVIVGGRVLDRLEGKYKDTSAGVMVGKDTVYPYIDHYTIDIMKAVEWAEKMYRSLKL